MNSQVNQIIREKGILLEKGLFELVAQVQNIDEARLFLDKLEIASGQKMITRSSLAKSPELTMQLVNYTPEALRQSVSEFIQGMGIKSRPVAEKKSTGISYEIVAPNADNARKIEVDDFVGHFRARYQVMQRILMQRSSLNNLVSINKISSNRQSLSIIGIVSEKRTTPNKNLIIRFEDLSGSISVLVKADSECFSKAQELQLDDIVAVKASGNNEFLYAFDIVYPDSAVLEKVSFEEDSLIAFVSDVHAGSIKHLGKEFESFLDWLNTSKMAEKLKFIFFVGDNVDGVGVFPGQERVLNLKSLKEQYGLLASYLRKVPKHITMFMCPGQHDSVRVAEPQPAIDNFYGEALHEIENLILVPNPTMIKLKEAHREFKVLMYHGASIHNFINEIGELRLLKAHKCPAKAVRHMLKRRHLAPSHGVSTSIVYVPDKEKDALVISEVPDILCTGEVHRLDIDNYNGTIIITGSCWQSQTDFEEKVGNVPDPCKVPIFNLRTREIKVLDFTGGSDEDK